MGYTHGYRFIPSEKKIKKIFTHKMDKIGPPTGIKPVFLRLLDGVPSQSRHGGTNFFAAFFSIYTNKRGRLYQQPTRDAGALS